QHEQLRAGNRLRHALGALDRGSKIVLALQQERRHRGERAVRDWGVLGRRPLRAQRKRGPKQRRVPVERVDGGQRKGGRRRPRLRPRASTTVPSRIPRFWIAATRRAVSATGSVVIPSQPVAQSLSSTRVIARKESRSNASSSSGTTESSTMRSTWVGYRTL